jgi:hypothetical protein
VPQTILPPGGPTGSAQPGQVVPPSVEGECAVRYFRRASLNRSLVGCVGAGPRVPCAEGSEKIYGCTVPDILPPLMRERFHLAAPDGTALTCGRIISGTIHPRFGCGGDTGLSTVSSSVDSVQWVLLAADGRGAPQWIRSVGFWKPRRRFGAGCTARVLWGATLRRTWFFPSLNRFDFRILPAGANGRRGGWANNAQNNLEFMACRRRAANPGSQSIQA